MQVGVRELIMPGVIIAAGVTLLIFNEPIQRLQAKIPQPIRYVFFDLWNLRPLSPAMDRRNKYVGWAFILLGISFILC